MNYLVKGKIMPRLLIWGSIVGCFLPLDVCAERKDIEVSYEYSHPVQTMRSAEADVTNRYVLLTDGVRSKFYSPKTEYIDSIESTPEGFENFNTFKRICYEKKQQELIPRVDGSFYVVKDSGSKTIRTYDVANGNRFKWEEPMKEIEWQLIDSTKLVLGYECLMAKAEHHGRKWTAWFSPDLPVADGPWKLYGLPGLILEAACEGGQYRFSATGVQYVENSHYEIYSERNWDGITGKEFWELRRECLENPSRNINSHPNTIVYKGVEYKKHLPREVVDYIETDY